MTNPFFSTVYLYGFLPEIRHPLTLGFAMQVLRRQDWFHPMGSRSSLNAGIHTGGQGVHITGEDTCELATGDKFVIGGDRPHDYLNMDRYIPVLNRTVRVQAG